MTPILSTVSNVALLILLIGLLKIYTLLLKLNGLAQYVRPIITYLLNPIVEAYMVVLAIYLIMNLFESMVNLFIANAPSHDTAKEAII